MRILFPIIFLLPFLVSGQDQDNVQIANEYFQQGEFEKSRIMYDDLAENPYNIPLISSNYLSLLKSSADFKVAERFLKKAIQKYPSHLEFEAHLLGLYTELDEVDKVKSYSGELLDRYSGNPFQLSIMAQHLASEQLYDLSLRFFERSRRVRGDKAAHALEMASIHRMQNDKAKMIDEYLNYAAQSPNRMNYVKNLLQSILQEEEDLGELETTLIRKMQRNPDTDLYGELLIWVELQRKNFYGAFVQSRAIDKRNEKPGDRSMAIGRIALDNKAWDDAVDIFEYISSQYKNSRNYSLARKYWIEAKEEKIKNTFPIDKGEIRLLSSEYHNLYKELAPAHTALEALRSKALLHAFYLDEIDSASFYLTQLVSQPRASRSLVSMAKLDLGDIYLLKGVHWEATLLYSQVEKTHKSHQLGYNAKLRNARLHYFTGNFSLAKGHLDILKTNTTREISNDAISLGMLITDNTALDTTDQVMQEFASIELLIFQNKKFEAKQRLISMLEIYEHHSVSDEIYWLLSKLELEFGETQSALNYLENILTTYSYDILADDAAFKKAEIYDFQIKDVEEAKLLYQQFLTDYPGSLYAAEARKRFRQLRGDFIN
ncbi:MAG: tetratricopeptide repeat protein [Cyclobacteriaceae bacterium]